jgi:hypothetical protein
LPWEKIERLIQSQAQKLNIPVQTLQHLSDSQPTQYPGIRIIFDSNSQKQVTLGESFLVIGLPVTRETLKPITQIIQDNLPKLARNYHQRQKDQLKRLVLSGIEERRSSLKDTIQQAEYTLESLNREMFELARKRELDKTILSHLEKPTIPPPKRISSEYSSLKKLVPSLYQQIEFEDNTVRAKTYPVSISYESDDYDIGTLVIELNLSRGQAKITNLTNASNGYPHPHVNESGEICLGNISTGLARMLGEFEIYGALELLHKFVHTYNEPDAYQKIQYWDDPDYCEEDDEYERCRNGGSYGRACLDCGDSECPYYDNALEECSEEPDFAKCVACGERCNAGKELLSDCHNENPLGCMTCSFSSCPHFRDDESCRGANPDSCKTCNIDYCQYKGVSNEAA